MAVEFSNKPAPFAFYAPMKPPTHPRPSGDRAIARSLLQLLGSKAALVSSFRSYEKQGDNEKQAQLFSQAEKEIERLIAQGRSEQWQGWITYHNYYKAPDLLGAKVSQALDIPYIIFESSRSPKRRQGAWANFAKAADDASDAARIIFSPTQRNMPALIAARPEQQKLLILQPFLPVDQLPQAAKHRHNSPVEILCVAMMRKGDKLASYHALSKALLLIEKKGWHLTIIGDGNAEAEVKTHLEPFAKNITYRGKLTADAIAKAYQSADIFIWPGVGEAFGMVYLEAQAYGLPVLAEDRLGIRDICRKGALLSPENDSESLAKNLKYLINSNALRKKIGQAGRTQIQHEHLRTTASETLWKALRSLPELANF